MLRFDSQRLQQPLRRGGRLLGKRREVQPYQPAFAPGDQQSAPGVEDGFVVRRHLAELVEDMRRRERAVAAEIDLRGRREPAQRESTLCAEDEGRLRQVHLEGYLLHPAVFKWLVQ